MRLDPGQEAFYQWQLSVGDGVGLEGDEGDISIPDECCFYGDLVLEVYRDLLEGRVSQTRMSAYLQERCILCVRNDSVKKYNDEITNRMPGEVCTFRAVNRMTPEACMGFAQEIPPETLDSYDPSELPPHELNLKVGSIIILLRNLDVKRSLCNGKY